MGPETKQQKNESSIINTLCIIIKAVSECRIENNIPIRKAGVFNLRVINGEVPRRKGIKVIKKLARLLV